MKDAEARDRRRRRSERQGGCARGRFAAARLVVSCSPWRGWPSAAVGFGFAFAGALRPRRLRLTANDIAITDRPWWIRSDVRTEVLRDSGLANQPLSILDDGLVERIKRAFSLHPWVAKVVRVTKSRPGRVEVEVVYRRPVAMVEAPGEWLVPVDMEGVVLPQRRFHTTETRRLSLAQRHRGAVRQVRRKRNGASGRRRRGWIGRVQPVWRDSACGASIG